jgi:hypothetical protein
VLSQRVAWDAELPYDTVVLHLTALQRKKGFERGAAG